jgi:hypothetical protein
VLAAMLERLIALPDPWDLIYLANLPPR